ncbi:MAG TPA: T9SS type A sorting domain-containing protein [Ignavibacteriaceae bacterium]|nr:T9SS type A sorting domain-containing protein [Ignavibacteriaceae bacterium]
MKSYLVIFILILLFIPNMKAQVEEMNCVEINEKVAEYQGQRGGYLLPSSGTLNVLIVFCQFPDDNYNINDPYWQKGSPPANMNQWVNQTWTINPITGSLTHYFNDMSFNSFKFIGKVISKTSQHTRQWYITNQWKRGDIHKEILQNIDLTWSFAEFDNWDFVSEYTHSNQPDGIVDMIIMVWRNIAKDYPDSLQLSIYNALNFSNYGSLGGTSFTVDNGLRTIKTGFWPSGSTPGGSGVTIIDQVVEKSLWSTIHEFAHYLMGGNEYHVGYGFWGMLDAWGKKSKVANSYERYRLGWINVNAINNTPNQTIYNATIPDYVTTGVVYRFNIDTATNQFFYIENHQKLSYWEQSQCGMLYGNIENGLYIIRQDGAIGSNVQAIPADGRFSWTVNQRILNPYGSSQQYLPVFKSLTSDRVNGYHDLQLIPWVWQGVPQTPAPIHFTENELGQPVEDIRFQGDGKDAFRPTFNEMFSPWSNPNSHKKGTPPTATPFGFKVNGVGNGVYSIDIYVGTALNGPPSKPQDFKVSVYNTGNNSHPKLNWSLNLEIDVINSSQAYLIERSINGGAFSQIATTAGSISQYIDYGVSWAGGGPYTASYKIRAKDTQSLTSVYTDIKTVPWGDVWKIGTGKEEVISEYNLQQNYPNPFNPTTTINYSIPKNGLVTIKVYDILGKEVAELVNETKEAGNYSVAFNASSLASGIYFYTLTSGNFTASKKLILLK